MLVGTERLHHAVLHDRSPPGWRLSPLDASPEGRDFWTKGVYREIVAPERIVCTDFFALKKVTRYHLTLRHEPRLAG